jgi:transposase-like protein
VKLTECTPGPELSSGQLHCPHCGDSRTRRWGFFRGSQRYRCHQCGRTFNALTGTSLARLRSAERWLDYRAAIAAQLSVRRAADRCGISVATALRWRLRIGLPPGLGIDGDFARAVGEEGASQGEAAMPPETPARGVVDFVEWARTTPAVDDGGVMRARVDGLFGTNAADATTARPGNPGEK